MDFLVTDANSHSDEPLETLVYNDMYPGQIIPDLSKEESIAVNEAQQLLKKNKEFKKSYLSPMISDDEDNQSEDENEDEDQSQSETEPEPKLEPEPEVPNTLTDVELAKSVQGPPRGREAPPIDTFTTPNLFSQIHQSEAFAELRQEVLVLRKKVALSSSMQSFLDKLNKKSDQSREISIIKLYAKKKFDINISSMDFESLTNEEIRGIYERVRLDSNGNYDFIYKIFFDIAIKWTESKINTYLFTLSGLEKTLLYEDIALEFEEFTNQATKRIVGKYIDDSNKIVKIIKTIIGGIIEAKFPKKRD